MCRYLYSIAEVKSPRSNNRQVEVSLLGTIHRRTHFFVQYIFAKIQFRTILTLLPIVEDAFRHPWVAKVELCVRFWPGRERLSPWNRYQALPMHWDAPITISVFRNRRGKRRQALCCLMLAKGRSKESEETWNFFTTKTRWSSNSFRTGIGSNG
jgi:hypothetical protein